MIRLEELSFHYPSKPLIFERFSLEIGGGEAWAVLGPSGCGKSTLLYLAAGLRAPTAGRVWVNGAILERPRPSTGLILQDFGLLPWATVEENVRLGFKIRDFYGPDGKHAPETTPPAVMDERVRFWIERLGLEPVRGQYPGQLSGGQRQRTAIARTLVLNPDLLLMDEPFASLDAPTRENLQKIVLQLRQESSLTSVIVTHSIEEAAVLGQKILILRNRTNRSAEVVDNPEAGGQGYADSEGYRRICSQLREILGETA